MSMPKFKTTKWKIRYCTDCKSTSVYYTCNKEHNVIERDNVPFLVPDMRFKYHGAKWSTLESEKLGQTFRLSSSKLGEIIMGCGIQAGGNIPNQWWMWAKVGSSRTIRWLEQEDDKGK